MIILRVESDFFNELPGSLCFGGGESTCLSGNHGQVLRAGVVREGRGEAWVTEGDSGCSSDEEQQRDRSTSSNHAPKGPPVYVKAIAVVARLRVQNSGR